MRAHETFRVDAPNGSGYVDIDVFDEHHMGAATTRIRPSRPVNGVSDFFATGGNAKFTSDSRWLVIYDRVLVVACDWTTSEAFHFTPPIAIEGLLLLWRRRPRSLRSVMVGVSGVRLSYETAFHTQREERELLYGAPEWSPGLGPAAAGEFPSAYEPDVRGIRAAT